MNHDAGKKQIEAVEMDQFKRLSQRSHICVRSLNGTAAIGTEAKTNPDHIATSLDCSSCHTTATFAGGSWTHDATSEGRCSDCHSDGGGATFNPVDHLQTDVQCDTCHVTTGCHGPSVNAVFTYPSERYAPFCAGCHERDFERKGDHIGGENGTVEQNKDCSNGGRGCHRLSDRNFD
ncbi:MAG: hypothetical protein V2I41_04085 [Pseudomonadales bacterium]|nr:hypothetical protein [Pseudomonadales bacterium]